MHKSFVVSRNRSCHHPDPKSFPWPVALLFASSSKKFVFNGRAMPSLRKVIDRVQQFIDKILWKHHFHGEPSHSHPAFKSNKSLSTPCFPTEWLQRVPIELSGFTSTLRRRLIDGARWSHGKGKAFADEYSNILPFHRFAFKWLQSSDYCVVPSDKDGVFTLVHRSEHLDMVNEKLLPDTYVQIRYPIDIDFKTITKDITKHAKDLSSAFDDPRIEKGILKPVNACDKRFVVAPVHFTCKSHKPNGEIGFRVLHNGSRSPFLGLNQFITHTLLQTSSTLGHLCFSTKDMLDLASSVNLDPDDMLIRCDMHNFFMDPAHSPLL